MIGAETRRFRTDRRITFQRADTGWRAIVETLAVDGTAPDRTGRMFEAATRAMIGRPITVTLDAAGRATDVGDREAHWTAQVDALDRAAGPAAAAMTAPLRAAPAAMQVQRLAGGAIAVIDAALIAAGPRATHAITLPSRGLDGTPATLAGTESVTREADGTLHLRRHAVGTLASGTSLEVDLDRRVSAGGVVLHSVETTRTRQGTTLQTVTRETRLTSPVS